MIALTDFVYKLLYYKGVGRRIFGKGLFSEDIASSFLFRRSLAFVLDITQFVRAAQNGINHFFTSGYHERGPSRFFGEGEGSRQQSDLIYNKLVRA